MPGRHRSRSRALQVLFLWDLRKQPIDEAISAYYNTLSSEEDNPVPAEPDEFMEILARGVSEQSPELDRRIVEKSENWRLERMAVIDRNILRLAVYEMLAVDQKTAPETPVPVIIDEALELARQYSGDESVSFINGVLDAVAREPK
jgi:N utilization substance protein B